MTHIKAWIANPLSPAQRQKREFLVDRGAMYTVVPRAVLSALGIAPHSQRTFTLADGREVTWGVGDAVFTIGDRQGASPVVFGEDRAHALLGVVTLEALGLGLDPLRKALIPIPLPLMLCPEPGAPG